METYSALVTVEDREFQNVQELASIWGEIRGDLEELDAEVVDTYAVLGAYDFLILFRVPDSDTVFETAITIESHGLDLQTMKVKPTDEFAEIVDDAR